MKPYSMFFAISIGFLLAVAAFSTTALAGPYTGLWVGRASIDAVSEVNQREPDLGFDLALTGVTAEDALVPRGADWKYDDAGDAPTDGWETAGFDDGGWEAGPAPLGYGGGEATAVSFGGDPDAKHAAVYLRKMFTVADPLSYGDMRIQVWRNDGIILYLNGEELLRNNISSSYVDHESYARTGVSDDGFLELVVPATWLTAGDNLLAAEVHIASANDNTLSFDLSLRGIRAQSENRRLIRTGADGWRYAHTEAGIADPAWKNADYDDAGSPWLTGPAPFGYGDGDEATRLVSDTDNTPAAAYFRKTFDAGPDLTHLRFELLYDDGAVVYVNGAEVFRFNLPAGDLTDAASPITALGSAEENRYTVREIAVADLPAPLTATGNVAAVIVYQHRAELDAGESETPLTRAPGGFELRLLVHVDEGDAVRLLKEAIVMYDEEAETPVIVADHRRISEFSGVAVKGDASVGLRLSAVNFDFTGATVTCDGAITPTGAVECGFTLASDHPTNPFLHRYHPDHDNLDARYENTVEDAYAVTRTIRIQFAERFPPDPSVPAWATTPPGWGDSLLGGVYTEVLGGLHKRDITVSGAAALQRVSSSGALKE